MSDIDDLLRTALLLADASAPLAQQGWEGAQTIDYKADGSAVTATDLAIETLWRETIQARYPDHNILGEEHGTVTGSSAYTWVFDPIDGTRQFGAGLLNYSSLIAVCRDEEPILGIIDLPRAGARFHAAKGQGTHFQGRPVQTSGRTDFDDAVINIAYPQSFSDAERPGVDTLGQHGRFRVYDGGSPAYGALARGWIDVCVDGSDLDAFDICALCPIVLEAGGSVTDWHGNALSLTSKGAMAASASAKLHEKVLRLLT